MTTAARTSPLFLTTRWSLVFAARDGATAAGSALEALCQAYWYPLYAYVRRRGYSAHDAQDLTQEFFARLLEREWLQAAAPERGRFRTLLLVTMKRLLVKEWHRAQAQKRGAGACHVSFDLEGAEERYAAEPSLSPDAVFERRWALTVIDDTMSRLEAEFAALGKPEDFKILADWLTAGRGEIPYEILAGELECSVGAARVTVHRLRKRFRELFRETIAATLDDSAKVEDEMRHLAAVLSGAV